jgi:hypothetical protein
MSTEITKESLLEYGMKEYDNVLFPMQKNLSENENENQEEGILAICITQMRNITEICLLMPNGNIIFLNVNSIEELQQFENCIESYDSN